MSLCFTLFAITGLTNAYNIIDGFNGLSSMVGIITLLALSYISIQYNDILVLNLCITMIGSILGFLIWNYPGGRIFLGDSGAYLIGLWIATISIILTNRHSEISPWLALVVNGYPVFETVFTIYRRKIHQGKNPGLPDGLHFHTLIYRRILFRRNKIGNWLSANARTAPYLWILSITCLIPAVFYYKSTEKLMAVTLIFSCLYLWIYKRIVKFKTPRWLYLL
jgi:UDP-N-acetylmuramyl pentapeptide phosphotransferase/UDP-N-acetylglucosamine-1-phosphate transferase